MTDSPSTDPVWEAGPSESEEPIPWDPMRRLARVERLVQGYHDVVSEGGVLAARVGHLDDRIPPLKQALEGVEESQRELIALNTRVDVMDAVRKRERRQAKSLAFTATALAVLILGGLLFGFFAYVKVTSDSTNQYRAITADVCNKRSTQAAIVQKFLDQQNQRIASAPGLTDQQKTDYEQANDQIRAAFPVIDCSSLTTAP